MAVDYKRFLAENVLSERRIVTYRLLSRALRVHCTLAKQMLYEFHRNENAKKPSSVNATYVIAGTQKPPESLPANSAQAKGGADDDDEIMQSSPYLPSSMPNQDAAVQPAATASIVLVREEDLEGAKFTFQSISSMHVYSLQATVLQDLNVVADASRELATTYANEDPLEYGKQWGMIQNSHVKRRTGPPAKPSTTGPSHTTPPKATVPAKRPLQKEQPTPNEENKEEKKDEGRKSQDEDSQQSQLKGRQPPAKSTERAAPKKEKNNLFSSFAKAKPKQKKEGSTTPAGSGAESAEPSAAEDVALDDASEEEPEDLFADQGKSGKSTPPPRETKKEREDKLKQMMEDDDDEEMPDAAEPPEEPATEEPAAVDQPAPKQPELKEEVNVSGGRRRGKRQVMKKKTVKDDEGYLVTVEEPTWESFSEDEPAPKNKPAVSGAPKGKPGSKAGQGNIMSFFGRK